jgi:hypothetical protein
MQLRHEPIKPPHLVKGTRVIACIWSLSFLGICCAIYKACALVDEEGFDCRFELKDLMLVCCRALSALDLELVMKISEVEKCRRGFHACKVETSTNRQRSV